MLTVEDLIHIMIQSGNSLEVRHEPINFTYLGISSRVAGSRRMTAEIHDPESLVHFINKYFAEKIQPATSPKIEPNLMDLIEDVFNEAD